MLRNGEFDIFEVFATLSESGDLDLWRYCATELWQRGAAFSEGTGETILHLAVKCQKLSAKRKLKVVRHILSFQINPLVRNYDNKKAIEYCTKDEIKLYEMLASYQKWKPRTAVMDWYGKNCRERLKTFLLVEKRLRLGLPRDLRYLILEYVAAGEAVERPVVNFFELFQVADLKVWLDGTTQLWQRGNAFDAFSGATILHLAVRCEVLSAEDKLKVVRHLMSFKINPFVLDHNQLRASDSCTKEEAALYEYLVDYEGWTPNKKVMDWYGPFCRQRLLAFLLVEKALQLRFPRRLRNRILWYIAETEYVWVDFYDQSDV
jgi:hypothetical protein